MTYTVGRDVKPCSLTHCLFVATFLQPMVILIGCYDYVRPFPSCMSHNLIAKEHEEIKIGVTVLQSRSNGHVTSKVYTLG